MLYTISEVREKLGKIMNNLLNSEIAERYQSVKHLDPYKSELENKNDIDNLVIKLSENIYDNDYWIKKLLSVNDEVFFSFYLRYYYLSKALSEREQSLPANLPEDDKEFFTVLLNHFWKSL